MFLYSTQVYVNTLSSPFVFPFFLDPPHFMVITSLYSSAPLHPSLPPVGLVENPLDACHIKTSWKLCRQLLVELPLFKYHFSINAVSSFGAVHLMWWWQPFSQIFHLLGLTEFSATFFEAYPSITVTSLKPSRGDPTPRKLKLTHYSFPLLSTH